MEAFRLDGRGALVTGAAQGIGAAVAEVLAAAGAAVALCDRDAAGLDAVAGRIAAAGGQAHCGVLDVRDTDAASTFVGEAAAELRGVHVLVNNAGGGFLAPFLDVRPKGEAALIAENFTSATHLIRATVPHLRGAGGGSIVNITSIEAHRAAPGFATYAAMKAALANLTASLALELAADGIRVNCVAPDMIPTPGIEPDPAHPLPVSTPLAVRADPVDVAHAVLFLAAPASRFVTGTTIHVDGGNLAAGGWRRQPDGTYAT